MGRDLVVARQSPLSRTIAGSEDDCWIDLFQEFTKFSVAYEATPRAFDNRHVFGLRISP